MSDDYQGSERHFEPQFTDDGDYIGPPVLSPKVFDEIIEVLAKNNGAFDRTVSPLTINGVAIDRAPF